MRKNSRNASGATIKTKGRRYYYSDLHCIDLLTALQKHQPYRGLRDSSVTMQRGTRSPLRYNTSRCILRTNLTLFTHKPWLQLASVRVITEIWWIYIGQLPINKAKNSKFSTLFIREGDIILEALLDCLLLLSWCGFKAVSASLCLCTSSVSLQIQVIVHSDNTNPIIASAELCSFHPHGVCNFSFSQKDFCLKK